MPLSQSPDLSASRRLTLTAAAVTLCVWVMMVWRAHDVTTSLGDTDDAMRLVLVRSLVHGQGWWDQWVGRLQPPQGVYMHWSRLLDGALAGFDLLLRTMLPPDRAETVMRFVWPLLWIFPVSLGGLAIARNLGARSAVFACAILLVLDITPFVQFRPGRIDHHNVQITMTVVAAACALAEGESRARWAALCGAASALGLAIGVEALAFHAVIGASFALRLLFDRREAAAARAYGLALAIGAAGLYALETPPARWLLLLCDAIAINLVVALLIGGLGLALVAQFAERVPARVRIGGLALVGATAALAYLGSDPICVRGPFAAVDPRLRPFWFDHIQELESWPVLFGKERTAAIHSIVAGMLSAAAALWLVWRAVREPRRGFWLLAALTLVAVVAQAKAYRMEDYGVWFGTPALAIALADLGERALKGRMIPLALVAILASPGTLADAAAIAANRLQPLKGRVPIDRCYDTRVYGPLARLPAGIVLAEPDLGSFILANTPHSVLSAPYHRMTWGILAAHDALSAPAAGAEAQVRALHAAYIVDCPIHVLRTDPAGLAGDLRRGRPPAWLQPLSGPREPLQIYRVTPSPEGR